MTQPIKILRTNYCKAVLCRLLLSVMVLTICATDMASAQSQRVIFPRTKITVRQAFEAIQDQTNYGIAFSNRVLNTERQISLSSRDMTVSDAMEQVLAGSGFTYSIVKDVITIKKAPQPEIRPVAVTPAAPVVVPQGPSVHTRESLRQESQPEPKAFQKPKADKHGPVIIVRSQYVNELAAPEPDNFPEYYPVQRYSLNQGFLPNVALKTNLLYAAAAFTPNLALEIGLGERTSLDISGSYNPWNRKGSLDDNKKLVHSIFSAEIRYWTCNRFNGHFLGLHTLYAIYNIGSYKIPSVFEKQYRYDGDAWGAGISYGYHLMLAKQWGLEFSAGVGVAHLQYKRYACSACNKDYQKMSKTYFGPTKAAVSLVFIIK